MKFLREPLIHFLILGAALFVIFDLSSKTSSSREQIVVTSEKIHELVSNFSYDARRPPTTQEVDRLIEDYVREEVLYREAVARGLDRDNPVVRRAMRQKMEFFSDSAEQSLPTDQQLQKFLEKHPDMFRRPNGSVPPLTEIRESLQNAWLAFTQKEARDAAYLKFRAQYNVVIQQPPTTAETIR